MNQPEQTSKGVAGAVKAALDEADITIRTAATQTGIPYTTLHRRIHGNSPFNVDELAKLATILDTNISELVSP